MQNGKSAGAAARPMLFQPHTIRGLTLKNRTVLAPMIQYRAREGLCGPFHTVHLSGLIRDPEGQKMSKTKGNVVDPLGVIDKSGASTVSPSLNKTPRCTSFCNWRTLPGQ